MRCAIDVQRSMAERNADQPDATRIEFRVGVNLGDIIIDGDDTRIVMLTGYANIATAVAAIKAGAVDYLPKPADADAVERALLAGDGALPPPPADPMSADRVRWEHIQRVFEQCERNFSETCPYRKLRPTVLMV
jgi:two-component system response regulator RegA